MLGLMQDWPLTMDKILDHARANYPQREIVSQTVEGPVVRAPYAHVYGRAKRLASALRRRFGVRLGERVATLAWNTQRHVETWYGVAGLGAVYHPLNPLMRPQQLVEIINHAEDAVVCVDLSFVPLLEKLSPRLPSLRGVVIYADDDNMPDTILPDALDYEGLLEEGDADAPWGGFDERTAAGLSYTGGTSGAPKGVLYSHRSNVLHALTACTVNGVGVGADDVLMPLAPMFHANGWGAPLAAPMAGAKLVLPGPRLDGESVCKLMAEEDVTLGAAAPIVWLNVLNHLERTSEALPALRRVIIGGSAAPEMMIRAFEDKHGVEVVHAWGMTETSPLGAVSRVGDALRKVSPGERMTAQLKQGRPPFLVELRTVDPAGRPTPRDGVTAGALQVRGAVVAKAYYQDAFSDAAVDAEGWLETGDMAALDDDGVLDIIDRAEDAIRSGGRWISSIALENIALGHPKVAEACAIAAPHAQRGQQPLLLVAVRSGEVATVEEILRHVRERAPASWVPEAVEFVDELPHTATGKLDKAALRARYGAGEAEEENGEP